MEFGTKWMDRSSDGGTIMNIRMLQYRYILGWIIGTECKLVRILDKSILQIMK